MKQQFLFGTEEEGAGLRAKRSGSFVDNMQLPVHRWFRYSAGFSAEWVRQLIQERANGGRLQVFDPFSGSGTVVLEAERTGMDGFGIEAHPFVARIGQAKLHWRECPKALRATASNVVQTAEKHGGSADGYAPLILKCYPTEKLKRLDALKKAWQELDDGGAVSELCWLALVSILRVTSPVGTAQWQYILPKKSKAKSIDPLLAYEERVAMLASDMAVLQAGIHGPRGRMVCEDSRECKAVPNEWADLVITSPPYANNYDYADATRLEMTFLGEIEGWADLQATVRRHLLRSCTQHIASYVNETSSVLIDPLLSPIAREIGPVCARMEAEKENHGGKKQYHAMIAHYFLDLARVWKQLRRIVKAGGLTCFVIGDSAPYGIHVPVERWLGELALAAGFKEYRFEKLRDRNTKWKNRKHRIPLHEGRLWVEG